MVKLLLLCSAEIVLEEEYSVSRRRKKINSIKELIQVTLAI